MGRLNHSIFLVIITNYLLALETKFYRMNRLNEILKKKGISQAHISREMGKSANTINNWCRNIHQFTLVEAKKLSEILECRIEDLIDDKERK